MSFYRKAKRIKLIYCIPKLFYYKKGELFVDEDYYYVDYNIIINNNLNKK